MRKLTAVEAIVANAKDEIERCAYEAGHKFGKTGQRVLRNVLPQIDERMGQVEAIAAAQPSKLSNELPKC